VRLLGFVRGPRKAPPGAISAWLKEARAFAVASATGKRGETVDEILEDLRSEKF
jgi:hypothetical protein